MKFQNPNLNAFVLMDRWMDEQDFFKVWGTTKVTLSGTLG